MNVILFDGLCSLCDASVQWVLRNDPHGVFHFAPLQSPQAQRLLHERGIDEHRLSSVMLISPEGVFFKSTAALQIALQLGRPWNILGTLLWIPRPLRDFGYDLVARNRHRFGPGRSTCRLPNEQEKARFL